MSDDYCQQAPGVRRAALPRPTKLYAAHLDAQHEDAMDAGLPFHHCASFTLPASKMHPAWPAMQVWRGMPQQDAPAADNARCTTTTARPACLCLMLIACLCARWCHICNDYRSGFESAAAAWPQHSFRWIDIEDEAELVGNVEVENFPTLLIRGDAGDLRFFGTVTPSLAELHRLVRAAAEHPLASGDGHAEQLAARLG